VCEPEVGGDEGRKGLRSEEWEWCKQRSNGGLQADGVKIKQ